jgi:hypothetical protein
MQSSNICWMDRNGGNPSASILLVSILCALSSPFPLLHLIQHNPNTIHP